MHRIVGFFIYSNGIEESGYTGFNEIGAVLGLSAVYIYNLLMRNSKPNYIYYVVLFVLCLIGAYFSKSRSVLVALIVCLVFITIMQRSNSMKKLALIIGGIFIIGYAFNTGDLNLARYTNTFDDSSFEAYTMNQRFLYWGLGIDLAFSSPINLLFGYGVGGLESNLGGTTTDSFFIDNLLRYGLLGTFALIMLYCLPLLSYNKGLVSVFLLFAFMVSISGNVLASLSFGGVIFMYIYSERRLLDGE